MSLWEGKKFTQNKINFKNMILSLGYKNTFLSRIKNNLKKNR